MLLYRSLSFSQFVDLKPASNSTSPASAAWSFTQFVLSRFRADRCSQVAASLTFTTLLALVPLMTIVLNLVSIFPLFSGLVAKLREFILANLLPQSSAKLIGIYMQQFSDNASRLTVLGGFFLGVAAVMLLYTIDRTFNRIWRIARPRPLLHRLVGYISVLMVWPVFIGISLTLTSYLLSFSLDATRSVPGFKLILLAFLPLLLTTLAFSWLYFRIPNRPVRVLHALIGGCIAAILFELMKRGFAAYITNFPSYKLIYGAFASLPVFLLWLYLSWIVILLGAEIAASLHYVEGGAWKSSPDPEQRFFDALRVLRAMFSAHSAGKRYLGSREIQASVPLGLDRIEHLLDEFAAAGFVRRLPGSEHYALQRTDETTLADVYRLVVLEGIPLLREFRPADFQLQRLMREISDGREALLNRSLAREFSTAARNEPTRSAESILDKFK